MLFLILYLNTKVKFCQVGVYPELSEGLSAPLRATACRQALLSWYIRNEDNLFFKKETPQDRCNPEVRLMVGFLR